jgi:malate synthase
LYLQAWLGGSRCVPIDNLMEDAATAEISARNYGSGCAITAKLDNGHIDAAMYRARLQDLDDLLQQAGAGIRAIGQAGNCWTTVLNDEFATFLTLDTYMRSLR